MTRTSTITPQPKQRETSKYTLVHNTRVQELSLRLGGTWQFQQPKTGEGYYYCSDFTPAERDITRARLCDLGFGSRLLAPTPDAKAPKNSLMLCLTEDQAGKIATAPRCILGTLTQKEASAQEGTPEPNTKGRNSLSLGEKIRLSQSSDNTTSPYR